jgi:hypothetical protein
MMPIPLAVAPMFEIIPPLLCNAVSPLAIFQLAAVTASAAALSGFTSISSMNALPLIFITCILPGEVFLPDNVK